MLKNVTQRCHTLIEGKGLVLDLLSTSLEHISKKSVNKILDLY